MQDIQGKAILVGCRVVFNLSGRLAIGEIVRIDPKLVQPFRIRVDKYPIRNQESKVVKVANEWSIVVLSSPDEKTFEEYEEQYPPSQASRELPWDGRTPDSFFKTEEGDGLSGILSTPVGLGSNLRC